MIAAVNIVNLMSYQGWEWRKISASGTLIPLPVFIISMPMRKFLVQGMTTGVAKG